MITDVDLDVPRTETSLRIKHSPAIGYSFPLLEPVCRHVAATQAHDGSRCHCCAPCVCRARAGLSTRRLVHADAGVCAPRCAAWHADRAAMGARALRGPADRWGAGTVQYCPLDLVLMSARIDTCWLYQRILLLTLLCYQITGSPYCLLDSINAPVLTLSTHPC